MIHVARCCGIWQYTFIIIISFYWIDPLIIMWVPIFAFNAFHVEVFIIWYYKGYISSFFLPNRIEYLFHSSLSIFAYICWWDVFLVDYRYAGHVSGSSLLIYAFWLMNLSYLCLRLTSTGNFWCCHYYWVSYCLI